MPYDVFISYASPDLLYAEELHNRLEQEGFKVWFDRARLAPGFDWHHEIEQGCENSRVMLPVLTPHWKNSDWTKFETYGAEAVIPLIFDSTWLDVRTPPLERFQAEKIEFTSPVAAQWPKLIAAIRRALVESRPNKSERIYNLRYRANDYFAGRDKDLIRIHEELHCNPRAVLTQGRVRAIAAMGGAGKTTLARHYAEKFWRCYSQMFWVDCRVGFEPEFAHIHDVLFPERSNVGLKDVDKAALARQELSGTQTRLLILDNAEDENSAMKWIPKTGGCHTLITSRFSGWSSAVRTIHLFVLEKTPAIDFLQNRASLHVSGPELVSCEILAEKLGYLPLALEQAAAYLEQQGDGFGFDDYVRLYDEATSDLLAVGALGSTEYPDSVITTWKPTIDKLPPEARAFLRLCAFFAATAIPIKLMIEAADTLLKMARSLPGGSTCASIANRELWVRSQVARLSSYSLVRVGEQSFSIHPLLLKVEQFAIQPDARFQVITNAIDLLLKYAPELADLPKTWTEWNSLNPHARELHAHSKLCKPATRIALLDVLARFAFGKARYSESIVYEQEAFDLAEETYGPDASETEDRLINYGESLRGMRRYDEAEKIFRRSLEWCKQKQGNDHITVATANNYLGLLLRFRGREDEAKRCFQEGIEICNRMGTSSGRTYVKLLLNLSYVCITQNVTEGERLARMALAQADKEFGSEDLLTLFSLQLVAVALNNQGKPTEALPLQKQAVERMLRVLGAEHPESLEAQGVLASISEHVSNSFTKVGKLGEAEALLRQALELNEKARGETHPKIPHRLNNLCILLTMQGRLEETKGLLDRAWKLNSGQHDLTSTRLLFVRFTVALLESKPTPMFLGQLKTLLLQKSLPDYAKVSKTWDIAYFIEACALRLGLRNTEFLKMIAATMNDWTRAPTLDSFSEWREQSAVTLDMPWP